MYFNLSSIFAIISSILAIVVLIYLRIIYKNDRKTKQMSKAAYVLLVAFLLQFISFIIFSIFSFGQSHFFIGTIILLSSFSPYILGRIIRNFDKVNNFIYLQMLIFLVDIILIVY